MPLLVPSSLFLHPWVDSVNCIATGRQAGSGDLFRCVPVLRVSAVRGVINELASVVSSSFGGAVAGNRRIRDRVNSSGSGGDRGEVTIDLVCHVALDCALTGVGVLEELLNDAVPDNDRCASLFQGDSGDTGCEFLLSSTIALRYRSATALVRFVNCPLGIGIATT